MKLFLCLALLGPALSLAQTRACLLESDSVFLGQRLIVKDCLSNAKASEAELRQMCTDISKMAEQFGAPAAKISYLPACPPAPQGRCQGLFGQPQLEAAYYARSDKDLKDTEASCKAQGGRWR